MTTILHGNLSGSSRLRKDVSFKCYYEQLNDKLVAHCGFNNLYPLNNLTSSGIIERNPRVYTKIEVTSIVNIEVEDFVKLGLAKPKLQFGLIDIPNVIHSFDLRSDLKPPKNEASKEFKSKLERKLLEEIIDAVDFLIKDNMVL